MQGLGKAAHGWDLVVFRPRAQGRAPTCPAPIGTKIVGNVRLRALTMALRFGGYCALGSRMAAVFVRVRPAASMRAGAVI